MLKLGKYRHYKGNEYEVIGVHKHSETLEGFVVYRALYGDREKWIRPLKMFTEEVLVNGKKIPRFSHVGQIERMEVLKMAQLGAWGTLILGLLSSVIGSLFLFVVFGQVHPIVGLVSAVAFLFLSVCGLAVKYQEYKHMGIL